MISHHASAQVAIHARSDRLAATHHHWAILGAPDLHGDGFDDIVVTMARFPADGNPSARIAVFPGRLDGADAGG
ncbi:MAG: hypothetical protein K1X88_13235 [Nannocystaceae bacterium]|nr:hypothetical protein [Nannocystaceae bacterium]